MTPALDARLVAEFPRLYRNRNASMLATCMCWGFDCGDGWFDLLHRLSAKLEAAGVTADQVKEKYGTLRFYFSAPAETYDAAEAAVDEAERESERTCEVCGRPGKINDGPWFVVRCEACETR
jgi:hypothetical protein